MAEAGWKRRFDEAIPLPRGRQLVTLEDTGTYITNLSEDEQHHSAWQAAVEALIFGRCDERHLHE
jgi:hypothetical protein